MFRKRVTFKLEEGVSDGMGGKVSVLAPVEGLTRVPAEFKPERVRERLEAGRLESAVAGTLRVRSCAALRTMSNAAIVTFHEIDGDVDYNIHAKTNPDQRNKFVEFTVERGGALK